MSDLLLPVFEAPIVHVLRAIGFLAPSAQQFESEFTAALIVRWIAVIVLLAFVFRVERLPLYSVGIRKPRFTDLLWSIGAGVLAAIVGIGLYLLTQGFQPDTQTAAGQLMDNLSLLGKIHLILNAAIVEEFFFRGFLIERIAAATNRLWIGVLVSFVVFVVSHLSGSGVSETFTIVSVGTLAFVLLYLWRRNLVLCIVAHAVGNSPLLLS